MASQQTLYSPNQPGPIQLRANGPSQYIDMLSPVDFHNFMPINLPLEPGIGTVQNVSVVTANGFSGTVASPMVLPAISLNTTVSGILKGVGGAIVAASSPGDYLTSPVANANLANSSITLNTPGIGGLSGGGAVSLGGSLSLSITSGGVTNAMLANPSVTINTASPLTGGGSVALGGTLNLGITLPVGTASALSPGATINGVNFTGASPITVTAAAGTLTGTALASGITTSSLLSVGSGIGTGVVYSAAGNLTAGNVNLATEVSGVLPVPNGGTGASTLTGYVSGNGTSAMTASTTIPGSAITGNISGNAANVTGTVAVANGGTGVTTSTGTGSVVLSNSPTLVTPNLDTPSVLNLSNATSLPAGQLVGTVAVGNGGTGLSSVAANNLLLGTGGSALSAVSLLPLAIGGTNANLTAANGAIPYSTASALALLATPSTPSILYNPGSATPPTWTSRGVAGQRGNSGTALAVTSSTLGSQSFATVSLATSEIAATTSDITLALSTPYFTTLNNAGTYLITGSYTWVAPTTGTPFSSSICINLNGTAPFKQHFRTVPGNNPETLSITAIISVSAGATVAISAWQNSGSTQSIFQGGGSIPQGNPYLEIVRLS